MTIRADMDAAFGARQRRPRAAERPARTVWRMSPAARHAFAACLRADSYLNIPIVVTDEISGFELAELPA